MRRLTTAIILLLLAFAPAHAQDDTRAFALGFTPFPYEISLDAVLYTLVEGLFARQRLDAQARAVRRHFDFAGAKAERVAKLLRDHQASCLVNGCTHARRLPWTRFDERDRALLLSSCGEREGTFVTRGPDAPRSRIRTREIVASTI